MHRTASCLQRGSGFQTRNVLCVGKNGGLVVVLGIFIKSGNVLLSKYHTLQLFFLGGDNIYKYIYIIGTLLKGISLMIFVGGSFVEFCESVVSYAWWMGVEVRDQRVGFSHLKSQLL